MVSIIGIKFLRFGGPKDQIQQTKTLLTKSLPGKELLRSRKVFRENEPKLITGHSSV